MSLVSRSKKQDQPTTDVWIALVAELISIAKSCDPYAIARVHPIGSHYLSQAKENAYTAVNA